MRATTVEYPIKPLSARCYGGFESLRDLRVQIRGSRMFKLTRPVTHKSDRTDCVHRLPEFESLGERLNKSPRYSQRPGRRNRGDVIMAKMAEHASSLAHDEKRPMSESQIASVEKSSPRFDGRGGRCRYRHVSRYRNAYGKRRHDAFSAAPHLAVQRICPSGVTSGQTKEEIGGKVPVTKWEPARNWA